MTYKDMTVLEAGLAHVLNSPKDGGEVTMIVRRPALDEREVLASAELDREVGLVGDNWSQRASVLGRQLTLMNARVIALLEDDPQRWPLAGDQLYVDLDLSEANLPPGTRLAIGTAVIEISPLPHNGCDKFNARFGRDALVFVNGPAHKHLHLRGLNATVVQPGTVKLGDRAGKVS